VRVALDFCSKFPAKVQKDLICGRKKGCRIFLTAFPSAYSSHFWPLNDFFLSPPSLKKLGRDSKRLYDFAHAGG
jgi:hypothetical protein